MKTAVDAVFARGSGGKERTCNRRFLRMCGHYLVEPVTCTPGVGLQGLLALSLSEKGQVDQVGSVAPAGVFATSALRER
jgi:hypothetical protein